MINFLLPAIKQRWPASERGTTIWIQQDNAKTHIPVDDPEFVAAAQADGWDIRLTCQPPNSPDLNILDLGFFAALQSIFHKLSPGSTLHSVSLGCFDLSLSWFDVKGFWKYLCRIY
jgi:hypothetical protein